jgi:hypothetical protein
MVVRMVGIGRVKKVKIRENSSVYISFFSSKDRATITSLKFFEFSEYLRKKSDSTLTQILPTTRLEVIKKTLKK